MRIKFDGSLFTPEDMDALCVSLKKDGILLEPEQQNLSKQKGLPELLEEVPAWIAALENELLPVLIPSLVSYFLSHKKNDDAPIICIEYTESRKRKKIVIPVDQPLNIELPFSPDLAIRIDVKKSTPSVPEQGTEEHD